MRDHRVAAVAEEKFPAVACNGSGIFKRNVLIITGTSIRSSTGTEAESAKPCGERGAAENQPADRKTAADSAGGDGIVSGSGHMDPPGPDAEERKESTGKTPPAAADLPPQVKDIGGNGAVTHAGRLGRLRRL